VPTVSALNPCPRSIQVGEFEVAIGGGIWVAIRELDSLLQRKIENLESFRGGESGVWTMIDAAYLVARTLVAAVVKEANLSSSEAHRLMMWQTALEYQMESFFLILDKQLDAGIALLRMASELARDIAYIANDESSLEIWLGRSSDEGKKKEYRKKFKFSNEPTDQYVFQLYNLASTFGVHGHTLSSVAMQPKNFSSDGAVVSLEPSDIFVYQKIEIWMAAFFPLQDMCNRAFRKKGGQVVTEGGVHYDDVKAAFNAAFVKYREALKEMKADILVNLH
jgi:hypothetical protein